MTSQVDFKCYEVTKCLFVYSHLNYFSAIWRLSTLPMTRASTLMSSFHGYKRGFYMTRLLRHGTSVYLVSSEGPDPTSCSGIRTCDARIIGSLRRRSNRCTTRAASNKVWIMSSQSVYPKNYLCLTHQDS
jgi:hypothetical protein